MEEPLIEFVRQHNCLYDKSNPDYKNIHLRNKKFEELAMKLNIPAKKLKARWRTLRDTFHKELRVDAYDSRVSSSTKKPWKWLDHLMFLKDVNNCSSSIPGKYPPQRKRVFQFTDSVDDALTINTSNTTPEVMLSESKDDLSQAFKFNFVEDQTSNMPSTHFRVSKLEDDFIIDESNEMSTTQTQDVLGQRDVKAGSAVHLFFTGLAKQTEEANITAKEFAQLQMKLLKVFNKEMYNI